MYFNLLTISKKCGIIEIYCDTAPIELRSGEKDMLNKLKEKIANVLYEGVNNLLYWVKGVKIIEQYDVKHLIHSLDFGEDNQLNQVVDLSRLDKEGVAILMEYVAEEVVVD